MRSVAYDYHVSERTHRAESVRQSLRHFFSLLRRWQSVSDELAARAARLVNLRLEQLAFQSEIFTQAKDVFQWFDESERKLLDADARIERAFADCLSQRDQLSVLADDIGQCASPTGRLCAESNALPGTRIGGAAMRDLLDAVVTSYASELRLKQAVLGDIMLVSRRDTLVAYASALLLQPMLDVQSVAELKSQCVDFVDSVVP